MSLMKSSGPCGDESGKDTLLRADDHEIDQRILGWEIRRVTTYCTVSVYRRASRIVPIGWIECSPSVQSPRFYVCSGRSEGRSRTKNRDNRASDRAQTFRWEKRGHILPGH